MSTPRPKKNQKEKPLKVDITADELLLLMGRSKPVVRQKAEEKKKDQGKSKKKSSS